MKNKVDDDYLKSERNRIGQLIKQKREQKGLTHEQLSEIMGVTQTTISKIENGKFNFSIDYINSFGHVLGFKVDLP